MKRTEWRKGYRPKVEEKHVIDAKKSMYDDYLQYREHLHALKGSATELGATELVQICLKGERLKPYDMGSEKVRELNSEVERIFNLTVTALQQAVSDKSIFSPGKLE